MNNAVEECDLLNSESLGFAREFLEEIDCNLPFIDDAFAKALLKFRALEKQSLTDPLDEAIKRIEAEKVASNYRPNEPEYYAYKRGLDKAISIIQSIKEGKTNE